MLVCDNSLNPLRSVSVTAAIYWGFHSKPVALLFNFIILILSITVMMKFCGPLKLI